VLGFVSADVVKLKNDARFNKLSNGQIKSVENFNSKNHAKIKF